MKKILLFIGLIILFSCEKPSDCFESTGAIISKEIPVSPFTRLEVYRGIAVEIMEGPQYQVWVQSGENQINNVEVTQNGSVLMLRDNTSCNWLREYGETTVFITAPNITEIYSKTERTIRSNGILTYPNLNIIAVDKDGDFVEGAGTGDFYLEINNNELNINNNSLSIYYISGSTNQFNIGIYNGDGRIEAQNLIVQNCNIYHRGSNDVFVRPIQSVTGKLLSTGNVILKNNPPINTLQTFYLGQVIYE